MKVTRDVKFLENHRNFPNEKNVGQNWFDPEIPKKYVEEIELQAESNEEEVFRGCLGEPERTRFRL